MAIGFLLLAGQEANSPEPVTRDQKPVIRSKKPVSRALTPQTKRAVTFLMVVRFVAFHHTRFV